MEKRLGLWDVLVPAAIFVVGAVELLAIRPGGWQWGILLEGASLTLLVWRRRHPIAIGVVAAAVLLSMPFAGPQLNDVAAPILALALIAYSFARWRSDLRGLFGIAAVLMVFLADYLVADSRSHDVSDIVFVSALVFPPYVFGRITRKLAVQSELLERQQEQIRDQAVRDERDRIARELHDVVAHSISAMVVQTAAAQDLVRAAPDRAADLLQSVADTGRRALEETGRLLHLIRDDADELGLRPAPGVVEIPALLTTLRESGLEVDADVSLPEQPLPGGVDVSAYRLVQECLTNALKYGDGNARLGLAATADRLRITCRNRPSDAAAVGSGLGLLGMAERVELLGGTMTSGRDDGGDFAVDIEIPLAREVVR